MIIFEGDYMHTGRKSHIDSDDEDGTADELFMYYAMECLGHPYLQSIPTL